MKRLLTKRQEQALRFCHHDFRGLTQKAAAKKMRITRRAVCFLLSDTKKVLPHYFPILTKQEAEFYNYYMEGWSVWMISEYTGISEIAVHHTLRRVKKKGMHFVSPKGRVLSFDQFKARFEDRDDEGIDTHIKQKF